MERSFLHAKRFNECTWSVRGERSSPIRWQRARESVVGERRGQPFTVLHSITGTRQLEAATGRLLHVERKGISHDIRPIESIARVSAEWSSSSLACIWCERVLPETRGVMLVRSEGARSSVTSTFSNIIVDASPRGYM